MPDRKLAKVTILAEYTDGTRDTYSKDLDDDMAGKMFRFVYNRVKDFKDLSDTADRGLRTELWSRNGRDKSG